ncbi:hypothetical protein [Brevibacterium samyangense]|uniref:Uncharacterized protein n=1 Tax=Brevibacterium samyangense TaxID=366888 RepID=A0ABP5EZ09_9MICO
MTAPDRTYEQDSGTRLLREAELSARLALAIGMAIGYLIGLFVMGEPGNFEGGVVLGLWSGGIGYGATFAGVFFIGLALGRHRTPPRTPRN